MQVVLFLVIVAGLVVGGLAANESLIFLGPLGGLVVGSRSRARRRA